MARLNQTQVSLSMEDTTLELGMKIPIQEHCHENWDSMCGSDQKRFCDSCDKNVHNLSEMTENQARDLLKEEESLCVRYRTHRSGHIRFRKALPLIALLSVGCDYVPPAESTDSFSVKIKKNVMRGSAHFLNRMFAKFWRLLLGFTSRRSLYEGSSCKFLLILS